MSWTMREAAEVLLAGRRAAKRDGGVFRLDPWKMTCAGFTTDDVASIEAAVDEIEQHAEKVLSALKRGKEARLTMPKPKKPAREVLSLDGIRRLLERMIYIHGGGKHNLLRGVEDAAIELWKRIEAYINETENRIIDAEFKATEQQKLYDDLVKKRQEEIDKQLLRRRARSMDWLLK